MANKKNNDFVESILEAQQNMVDTFVENTKKVTDGNPILKDMMDKGTETFNSWKNKQKDTAKTAQEKINEFQTGTKENTEKMNQFFQNWYDTQLNWTKKAWEMNQDFLKNANPAANQAKNNPMEWFKNMNQFWMNWSNQNNQQQQWASWMQQFNPANMNENWKKSTENGQDFYNQYLELMQNSFSELQQNMQSTTTKDAYNNMINAASAYGKFYQLWAPFWKSIQDKSFNSEVFKNTFNPENYKELTDNLFGFLPEGAQNYRNQAKEWWNEGTKQFFDMQQNALGESWNNFKAQNPFFNNEHMFATMLGNYQDANSWFKNAVSPIARMVTPNQYTKAATEWSEIMDQLAVYQIKNAELQYMIYLKSNEVMEQLVKSVSEKVEKGEEVKSIISLYQEWLNISDNVYVSLFESDAYSKLMAEVSALQLKLRKEIDLQMEKSLTGIPVATRSELDELYKVIYDLKKEVRQLEKMLEIDNTTEKKTAAKSSTTKTAKK